MRFKQQISACFATASLVALAGVFGFDRGLSAFEQTPGQTPPPAPQQSQLAQPAGATQITADEAVRMALENNLGIQAERLGPEIGTLGVAQARAAYAPSLISTTTARNSTEPPGNFLTGSGDIITDESFRTNVGLQQQVPWGGGRYQFTLDASRQTTNAFTNYNPQLGSNFAGSYVQPLLRGFRIDGFRQQLLTSRNNQVIADIQLREQVTLTSQAVRFAYFDLVGAIEGLKVAQLSLELSRASAEGQSDARRGRHARADRHHRSAGGGRQRRRVGHSGRGSNQHRPGSAARAGAEPVTGGFLVGAVRARRSADSDAGRHRRGRRVQNALTNRTDIARLKKQLDNVDVNMKFNQDARMPALDVVANYNLIGLAGTQFLLATVAGLPAANSARVAAQLRRCPGGRLRQRLPDLERAASVQLSDRPQRRRRGGGVHAGCSGSRARTTCATWSCRWRPRSVTRLGRSRPT